LDREWHCADTDESRSHDERHQYLGALGFDGHVGHRREPSDSQPAGHTTANAVADTNSNGYGNADGISTVRLHVLADGDVHANAGLGTDGDRHSVAISDSHGVSDCQPDGKLDARTNSHGLGNAVSERNGHDDARRDAVGQSNHDSGTDGNGDSVSDTHPISERFPSLVDQ